MVAGGLAVFPRKLFAALSGGAEIVKGRSDGTEGGGPRLDSRALTGNNPWTIVSALFAGMSGDCTIEWPNKREYLRWDERCRGEAIIIEHKSAPHWSFVAWSTASKLRLNWSPELIAGWLKRAHPGDGCYHVSHEAIYRSLFVQTRGVLKKELLVTFDRSGRSADLSGQTRMAIDGGKSIVSIRERPAAVEDVQSLVIGKAISLSGSKNSYIATLVERGD